MTMSQYLILSVLVLGSGIAVIAAILIGLGRALERAGWPTGERRGAWRAAAALLSGWFAVAIAVAAAGLYGAAPGRLPTIQFGIALPLLAGLAVWRSAAVSRLIDAVPQHWLVAVQFYRVLGAVFLALYAADRLPAMFAVPAGANDVAIGLLAPLVAFVAIRGKRSRLPAVLLWNLYGLADLIGAFVTGAVTSSSPLQLFAFDRPSDLVTQFPLVLIPTFLVPLAVLLHLASLTKLARAGKAAGPHLEAAR